MLWGCIVGVKRFYIAEMNEKRSFFPFTDMEWGNKSRHFFIQTDLIWPAHSKLHLGMIKKDEIQIGLDSNQIALSFLCRIASLTRIGTKKLWPLELLQFARKLFFPNCAKHLNKSKYSLSCLRFRIENLYRISALL